MTIKVNSTLYDKLAINLEFASKKPLPIQRQGNFLRSVIDPGCQLNALLPLLRCQDVSRHVRPHRAVPAGALDGPRRLHGRRTALGLPTQVC